MRKEKFNLKALSQSDVSKNVLRYNVKKKAPFGSPISGQ
jgi:hypothetical protein